MRLIPKPILLLKCPNRMKRLDTTRHDTTRHEVEGSWHKSGKREEKEGERERERNETMLEV